MKKKIIIFLIIFSILFSSASFCSAIEIETERGLEITYPPSPAGTEPPRTTKTYLPQYILYIVEFFIVFGALAALAALIFGGFRYLTSAGSPGAMTDARDQIFAGILGLVLLISSFLILRTINPQLTSFKITAEPKFEGIVLYRGITDCGEAEKVMRGLEGWKETLHYLEGQGKAARYTVSTSDLREISGNNRNEVLSIRFPLELYNQKTGDLKVRVVIYPELNWLGTPSFDSDKDLDFNTLWQNEGCYSFTGKKAGSLLFTWKTPGVYLCSTQLEEKGGRLICPATSTEKIYTLPRPQYPDLADFVNKPVGIKFQNIEGRSYGAILHSDPNFLQNMTVCLGDAKVLNYSDNSLPVTVRNLTNNYGPEEANCLGWVEKRGKLSMVKSLTVFQWDENWATSSTSTLPTNGNGIYTTEELYKDSVVLYEEENFGGRARVFQLKYEATHGDEIDEYDKCVDFFGKEFPIMVYRNFNVIKFNLDKDGNIITNPDTKISQNIRSLKILGNYLVILCSYYNLGESFLFSPNVCEVFFSEDSNLTDNPIGRCRNWRFWRLTPCSLSMVIVPILPFEE